MIYITTVVLLIFLAIDFSGIRQRTVKEKSIYAVAMLVASAYIIALSLGWEHPTLLEILTIPFEKPAALLRGLFCLSPN